MRCFKCRMELPEGSNFCQYCGADLTKGYYCPVCGAEVDPKMSFCHKCGVKVQNTTEIAPEDTAARLDLSASTYITTETMFTQPEDNPNEMLPSTERTPEIDVVDECEEIPPSADDLEKEPVPVKKNKNGIRLLVVGILAALFVGVIVFLDGSAQKISPSDAAKRVLYLEIYDLSGDCIGSGSGFPINDSFTIVTNYHVIEDACRLVAKTADGKKTVDVNSVLAYDKDADIAILKSEEALGIFPLPLADSDLVKQGDKVYAVGYPLGISNTLSDGIVSSRYIDENGVDLLQITAPISGGSSGGALLNEDGHVIGVICAYFKDGQNMNLAIASNTLKSMDVLGKDNVAQSLESCYRENHPITKIEPIEPIEPLIPVAPPEESNPPEINEHQKEENESIPCSHSFGAWSVEKEATCEQQGEKVRECSVCGETQQESIPGVDHKYVSGSCIWCGAKDPIKAWSGRWVFSNDIVEADKDNWFEFDFDKKLVRWQATYTNTPPTIREYPFKLTAPNMLEMSQSRDLNEISDRFILNADGTITRNYAGVIGGSYREMSYTLMKLEIFMSLSQQEESPESTAPAFTQKDLQGKWIRTWNYEGHTGYSQYVFSGNKFYWEQRAARPDAVLQERTGTYEINGNYIVFYPESYLEDGTELGADYRLTVSQSEVQVTKETLTFLDGPTYAKQ